MAESKQEATTYECDAPKCDVEHVCVGVQEPKGLRLTAQAPYQKARAVYACKPTHIRPAVEAVLEAQAKEPAGWEGDEADEADADPRTESERDTDEQFDIARSNGDTTHADRLRVADVEDEALEEQVPAAVGQ